MIIFKDVKTKEIVKKQNKYVKTTFEVKEKRVEENREKKFFFGLFKKAPGNKQT